MLLLFLKYVMPNVIVIPEVWIEVADQNGGVWNYLEDAIT